MDQTVHHEDSWVKINVGILWEEVSDDRLLRERSSTVAKK